MGLLKSFEGQASPTPFLERRHIVSVRTVDARASHRWTSAAAEQYHCIMAESPAAAGSLQQHSFKSRIALRMLRVRPPGGVMWCVH